MEFAEVDNHDDFYVSEDGRVHVQDQRGCYVVYDVAIDDFKYICTLTLAPPLHRN